MVSFRALRPFSISITFCTLPLPQVRSPMIDRPMMILQAGGDDFAGTGAVAIDQHHDRKSFERARLDRVPDAFGGIAALRADDPPLGDEHVADFDGRGEQAARD